VATKEKLLVTRLTIEIGAEFPIGISVTHALGWTTEWADSRGSERLQASFSRCGCDVRIIRTYFT
jgi:hypothetical protein